MDGDRDNIRSYLNVDVINEGNDGLTMTGLKVSRADGVVWRVDDFTIDAINGARPEGTGCGFVKLGVKECRAVYIDANDHKNCTRVRVEIYPISDTPPDGFKTSCTHHN